MAKFIDYAISHARLTLALLAFLLIAGFVAYVTIPKEAEPATRIPRSALTFSSGGDLGVRVVGEGDKVEFLKVTIAEDAQSQMWVNGIADGARVIVQGQDFVREGEKVTPVQAAAADANAKTAEK